MPPRNRDRKKDSMSPRSSAVRELPRLLTIDEVAEHLGVGVKWGHLLRFDPTEIQAWSTQSKVEPSA
jgi:hypothetical protein